MTELSQGQTYAYGRFKQGENLFISGPGGSGKSHLVKYFVNDLHTQGKIHQVTSTTGCSSILLSNNIRIGGRPIIVKTIHSWSGIRLAKGTKDEIIKMVQKNKRVVKEWKRIKTLVIDEVSMMSYKIFDVLETLARTLRKNDRPFGGIQLVCLGDFFQLPPVGDYNDPASSAFCFESPAWNQVFTIENHIELTTIFRQTNPVYQRILNEVRIGQLSEESKKTLEERVGLAYDSENHGGVIPMKIFATRNQVNMVNNTQYDKLEEKERVYRSHTTTTVKQYIDSGELLDEDTLERCRQLSVMEVEYECNNLTNNMPSDPEVKFKKGTPVMCLVNLDVESGIANGSMGIIEDFVASEDSTGEKVPLVRFINGILKPIAKYTWQSSEFPTICVSQIPLCLAYANSIHKMQGSTLDVCEMNLGGSIFAEHQIYVALSRVKSMDGVYLSAFHPHRIRVNPNVVQFYRQFRSIEELSATPKVASTKTEIVATVGNPLPESVETECPICLDDMEKPYITECSHIFCQDCITRLISCTHTGRASCPMCRMVVTTRSLKSVLSKTITNNIPHVNPRNIMRDPTVQSTSGSSLSTRTYNRKSIGIPVASFFVKKTG